MKVLGYEVGKRTLLVNGCLIAGAMVVIPSVVYSVANSGCGEDSSAFNSGIFSCNYLGNMGSSFCPAGFPNLFDLCVQGFRGGFELATQGVESFSPTVFNQTYQVCNNFFGNNVTADCTNSLNDQCMQGAEVGFAWEKSAMMTNDATSSACSHAASNAGGAAAGLTLLAGLFGMAANAVLNRQHAEQRYDRLGETQPLSAT